MAGFCRATVATARPGRRGPGKTAVTAGRQVCSAPVAMAGPARLVQPVGPGAAVGPAVRMDGWAVAPPDSAEPAEPAGSARSVRQVAREVTAGPAG